MPDLKKVGGDYIPVWDGTLENWEDYVVRCGVYTRGCEPWKVHTRVANLIQHLDETGKVWQMIRNLSEQERIALQSNIQTYLDFIKDNCLPTALPELGRRFREWLKFRRSKGETMRVYYKRFVQHLGKMEQCMQLVQDHPANIRKFNKMIKLRLIQMDKFGVRGSGGSVTSEATPMAPFAKTPSVRSNQSKKSHQSNKVPRPFESPPPRRKGKWVRGRFVIPDEEEGGDEEEQAPEDWENPWDQDAADWGDHASEIRRGTKAKEAMDHDPTTFERKSGKGTEYSFASDLGA